jgi:hypothetical protein
MAYYIVLSFLFESMNHKMLGLHKVRAMHVRHPKLTNHTGIQQRAMDISPRNVSIRSNIFVYEYVILYIILKLIYAMLKTLKHGINVKTDSQIFAKWRQYLVLLNIFIVNTASRKHTATAIN